MMLISKILYLAAAGTSLLASLPISVLSQSDSTLGVRPVQDVQPEASCIPNPSRPIDAEEKYLIVNLSEPNNQTNQVDWPAVQGAISQAYTNEATACTLGSSRSLTNCTFIIENVKFTKAALLAVCQYESNSIDGNTFLGDEDLYTRCTCPCGDPPTDFPALATNGTCSCSCIGDRGECVCYPPSEQNYVEIVNEIYQGTTDDQGRNVSVVGISDLEILDCGTPLFTYNATSVCVPSTPAPTPATPDPTPSPTEDPNKPTNKPTRRPSKKPTKHPTKSPTGNPTAKPTKRPSKPPTNKPTHAPTKQQTICEEVCLITYYSRLCQLLEENNLCEELNNEGKTFTLFAPLNSAFSKYEELDLSLDVAPDMKTVLKNHVVDGSALTVDALICGEKTLMQSGETTETKCETEKARRVLQSGSEFQTIKFQVGKGNRDDNLKPEIWPTFLKTKNGNIIEVDEIIIPELRIPTAHPTRDPTASPTASPTKRPTKSPTKKPTNEPTISPAPCTEDDKDWSYTNDADKDCKFVEGKPSKRCKTLGAKKACCVTCT